MVLGVDIIHYISTWVQIITNNIACELMRVSSNWRKSWTKNLGDTGNNWRVRKKTQTKRERDICKIEPVPSGGIDFSLIKVHNWFNSGKGTFAVKASP